MLDLKKTLTKMLNKIISLDSRRNIGTVTASAATTLVPYEAKTIEIYYPNIINNVDIRNKDLRFAGYVLNGGTNANLYMIRMYQDKIAFGLKNTSNNITLDVTISVYLQY